MTTAPTPAEIAAAQLAVHHAIGELVHAAADVGADPLARELAAAITPADRAGLLAALRRALVARGDPDGIAVRLAVLETAERALQALGAVVEAVCDADGADLRQGTGVDLVGTGGQDAEMPPRLKPPPEPQEAAVPSSKPSKAPKGRKAPAAPPPVPPAEGPSSPGWEVKIAGLVTARDDAALIDLATGLAGGQGKLAKLSGTTTESISRVRHGHRVTGFSPAMRVWLHLYLVDHEHPPPPLPSGVGPKARPGTTAPQVKVTGAVHKLFLAALKRSGRSQADVVTWCITEYLARHPGETPPPLPKVKPGTQHIRARVAPDVLDKLDARVGFAARSEHIRAALAEGLHLVPARTSSPS